MHEAQRVAKAQPPRRAVILAAGEGRRLRPHTAHVPKPLLAVHGRPTLDYLLTAMTVAGVDKVCIIVGYRGAQIRQFVGDGSNWGLEVEYGEQPEPLGTGDALRRRRDFLKAPTLVTAADYALPPRYLLNLKLAYLSGGQPLAASLKRLAPGSAEGRSAILRDDDGRILQIIEKPAPGKAPSQIGASLIFIVPPGIRAFLHELERSPRGEYDLQSVINRMLSAGYSMTGCLQQPPPEWQP